MTDTESNLKSSLQIKLERWDLIVGNSIIGKDIGNANDFFSYRFYWIEIELSIIRAAETVKMNGSMNYESFAYENWKKHSNLEINNKLWLCFCW